MNDLGSNKLNELKNILKEKQNKHSELNQRINEQENELKVLELQRKKIIKRKKCNLGLIIFYMANNVTIYIILMNYVSLMISRFNFASIIQKKLNIIAVYIGVILISVIGALISAKIGDLTKRSMSNKIIDLSNKIEVKQNEIKIERERQKIIEKEITKILNEIFLDNNLTKVNALEPQISNSRKKDYMIDDSKKIKIYTRIKKKDKFKNNI